MARETLTAILVWLTNVSTVVFRLLPGVSVPQNGSSFKAPSLREWPFSLPPYYCSRVPVTSLSHPTST
jgi:hypothetical protein